MPFFNKLFGRGRGSGRGPGRGQGMGAGNPPLGRQPEGMGEGPAGECVCPNCGTKASHQIGAPCYEQKCPKCQTAMTRDQG